MDKIGRPLYVDRVGSVHADRLMKLVTDDQLRLGMLYTFEKTTKLKFYACSDLYDRQISQGINIFDAGGFHMGIWTR